MKEKADGAKILNSILSCSADCAGDFTPGYDKFLYEEDLINWLYHNLPTMPYIVDQIVNFIFSNGMTTGDEKQDEKLDEFLYSRNIKGVTNYTVIQESIKRAVVFGKNGLRWLNEKDGIIDVDAKLYGTITDDNEEYYGFKDILGYLVSMDETKVWDVDTDELSFNRKIFEQKGILVDKDNKRMLIGLSDFLNLRNDTSKDGGDSPLRYEQQRTKLLTALYERMIYDLEYDGPGRILLRLKSGYEGADDNATSTTEILSQSIDARNGRRDKAKREAALLGKEIKDSKSDSVIVISPMFEENIEHLPRTTDAADYFDIIENEGVIISQLFGIPPVLLNLGEISGNVSMEKLIDNAMTNTIVPMRERFATQISGFLAEKIGVDKIYFDKYEMSQAVDENDKRVKVVDMIKTLVQANYNDLADKFAEMLDEDISTGSGKVKSMKLPFAEKIKQLFNYKEDK